MAAACAEAFVRDNGYTDRPSLPVDQVAWESIEMPFVGPESLLALRKGTIEPRAEWLCPARFLRKAEQGYTVGFRYRHSPSIDSLLRRNGIPGPDTVLRAVSMSRGYRELRMEHMPLVVGDPDLFHSHCQQLKAK